MTYVLDKRSALLSLDKRIASALEAADVRIKRATFLAVDNIRVVTGIIAREQREMAEERAREKRRHRAWVAKRARLGLPDFDRRTIGADVA